MGKKFERYKQNHDLGPKFVGKADGVGGLIIPAAAVRRVAGRRMRIDGIVYPFVTFEGKRYPIIKTAQGWTIGGDVAVKQHKKNVATKTAQ